MIRAVILLPASTVDRPARSNSGSDDDADSAGHFVLSEALVRVLVSMAENSEDPFQAISLEILAEIGQ